MSALAQKPFPDQLGCVRLTFFVDVNAFTLQEEVVELPTLAARIATATAASKERLELLKLATFGTTRTLANSLRHNANVLTISGIEADYDAERISFDDAHAILVEAGLLAVIYTSPRHTEDAPRWRILCPFSQEYPPARRDDFMGRLNGLFRGLFSSESWTLSQSYYLAHLIQRTEARAAF